MYNPSIYAQEDVALMHGHIRANPFAQLITCTEDGLNADHLPVELCADRGPHGVIRGHVAIANPVWRTHRAEDQALIVFSGPNSYVSPSWYPSKQDSGEVVPTWNYIAVHAAGPLRFIQDADFLRAHLDRLTSLFEDHRDLPWALSDAPDAYAERMLRRVVGFELTILKLTGKWKMSQNRPILDHAGVMTGLAKESTAYAQQVRAHVEESLRLRSENDR